MVANTARGEGFPVGIRKAPCSPAPRLSAVNRHRTVPTMLNLSIARASYSPDKGGAMTSQDVWLGKQRLPGTLDIPDGPVRGLVVFAHGSGSGRLSPRNRHVAAQLNRRGLATLLFDLLTEAEAADRSNVFDIPLLAWRLREALTWQAGRDDVGALPAGLFGASTGAAAALLTAAEMPDRVAAVVARGGRPDLAEAALPRVRAPTLLIVGSADTEVLALNRLAVGRMNCPRELRVVPRATHLFQEPGALDAVADLAGRWFEQRMQEASHA
jgi:putative phosphoribosyl transferase